MDDKTVKIRITRHIDTAGRVFNAGEYFVTPEEAEQLREKPGVTFPDATPAEGTSESTPQSTPETPVATKAETKKTRVKSASIAPEATVTEPATS